MVKADGPGPVVIVDDDEDALQLAGIVYGFAGLPNKLMLLSSGKELIKYLDQSAANESEMPSMILLDVNMPDLNGHETLRLIRSNQRFDKRPPIIMFTASNDDDDRAKALKNGANAYQVKPHDIDECVGFLKSLA